MYIPRSKSITSNPVKYLYNREYNDSPNTLKQVLSGRLNKAKSLFSKNLLAHFGCVNAVEFSNGGEFLASGGDDRRVLLWNVEESLHGASRPTAMRAQHISNIFCLGYDSKNTKIFSAGNDDQVIVHDTMTGDPIDFFLHEQPVYSLSVDPSNDSVFASACDDGRILIYDIREPSSTVPFALAVSSSAFHGVTFNPTEPLLVATANAKDGAALWDVRKPKEILLRYGLTESCMSVRWDGRGMRLLALRRRLPPVLYPLHSTNSSALFDHPSYYNSCTMKTCCFAGEHDQFVLSGSDDFNLYMWKIPDTEEVSLVSSAHMILSGHRSIVNQVRFNSVNYLIASSGVEKLIKVWSPFPLPNTNSNGEEETEKTNERKVFSHEEYISLVLTSGQFISHDYSHQSTKEDPRMMAFFDSLVQREIEGWTSGDSRSEPPSPLATDQSLSDGSSSSSDTENQVEKRQSGETKTKEPATNPIVQLITRKRAQRLRFTKSCHTKAKSSDTSDSGTAVNNHRKHSCKRKRRRTFSTSSESDTKSKTESPCEKRKKLLVWEEEDSLGLNDHDQSSVSQKEASTSSETPDSGIAIPDTPTSSKSKLRSHRNYRRHVPDSDSD